MALETLAGLQTIGEYKITRGKPEDMSWDDFDNLRAEYPICITDNQNMISFKIQNGPIKEFGINGCQVDTLIETAKIMLAGLNKNFPCRENSLAITKLEEALLWLGARKARREKQGIEGTNAENTVQTASEPEIPSLKV